MAPPFSVAVLFRNVEFAILIVLTREERSEGSRLPIAAPLTPTLPSKRALLKLTVVPVFIASPFNLPEGSVQTATPPFLLFLNVAPSPKVTSSALSIATAPKFQPEELF